MPLLLVFLTLDKYRILTVSMRSPGGARTILIILSIGAGQVRFILFPIRLDYEIVSSNF